MAVTTHTIRSALGATVLTALIDFSAQASAQTLQLRYGHINPPGSAAGVQAQMLADAIAKNSNGRTTVTVYPSSQLGKLQELTEAVSTATIAFSHNTAGGIGSLYEPFSVLDTPYIYRDYDHLMKVTDAESPVMKKLNEGLINAAGVRVLYAYYIGTRHLTANKAMLQPSDLAGQKIRAAPLPIYMAVVQGLGAIPIPVDLSEVATALATGQVAGQESPLHFVLSNKLYDTQSHLMLTGHIMNVQLVVINERVWQKLTQAQRDELSASARDARKRASEMVRSQEDEEIEKLKGLKMNVIGLDNGLNLDAYKMSVSNVVQERYGAKFSELYKEIAAIK
jgi:tripartite ATP-independent transporter DctP family solute receptor